MKFKEITPALDALKKIKIMSIEDKDVRNLIISNHIKLLSMKKKYDSDFEDARVAFLAAYGDEQEEVIALREELQAAPADKQQDIAKKFASHKKYLEAVKEFNDNADKMGEREFEIPLIETEKFVEEYKKQGYDMSVVEALFPMFNN